jgi:hypothetical protein
VSIGEVYVAMYDDNLAREPPFKAPCYLGGECNLGDEHKGLLVAFDTLFDECEVHFGFPTAGNSM